MIGKIEYCDFCLKLLQNGPCFNRYSFQNKLELSLKVMAIPPKQHLEDYVKYEKGP